jgi:hypothetical protein
MGKDYLGRELHPGDKVAYMQTGYRSLEPGVILSVAKCKVTIMPHNGRGLDHMKTTRFFAQVVRCSDDEYAHSIKDQDE